MVLSVRESYRKQEKERWRKREREREKAKLSLTTLGHEASITQ